MRLGRRGSGSTAFRTSRVGTDEAGIPEFRGSTPALGSNMGKGSIVSRVTAPSTRRVPRVTNPLDDVAMQNAADITLPWLRFAPACRKTSSGQDATCLKQLASRA